MPIKTSNLARLLPVAAIAMTLFGAAASPALADISGDGCKASAKDTAGKANPASIDIAQISTWHVSKDSKLEGEGSAPSDQTFGKASAAAFGFGVIQIAGGTGSGKTGTGALDVSQYSQYVRVFAGVGSSDSCSGSLTVVVDDVSAIDTLVGKIAVGLLIVGFLILIAVVVRSRPPGTNVFPASLVGAFGGFLAALGLYEYLVQSGSFDPLSKLGLAFLIVGLIIGLLCGIFGGRRLPDEVVVAA
ncbi:MAG: hypothetical protein ACR2MY_00775 [Candidatus Dormibacteria bacterium]